MTTAKVFMSGRSQAVRLPKEFRFDCDEVEISREGDAVVLRPVKAQPWQNLKAALEAFDEDRFLDMFPKGREQPGPQDRPGLDDLFA